MVQEHPNPLPALTSGGLWQENFDSEIWDFCDSVTAAELLLCYKYDTVKHSWNGQFHLINRCRNSILILLVILGFGFLLQLGSFVLGFDLDQCWIHEIYDFLKLIRSPDFCDFIEKSRILEEYFFRFPRYKNTGLNVGDVMFIVSQYYFSNYCSERNNLSQRSDIETTGGLHGAV